MEASMAAGNKAGMTTAADSRAPRSLWSLRRGEGGVIAGYDDSLAEHYRVRLMEMGFHPGETVTCLQAPAFGSPKVFRVSNTVFSLDDEVASHIKLESHDT
ncbi:FeoA family protein [Pseudohaliea sp.]|uniref:FeoA family protein n=1 Tax=Pseudohaliea sp. TaxID=2740289 RepID=UPI0032EA9E28